MTATESAALRASDDDQTDYDLLRDEIVDLFNPRDDDVAEVAILMLAVREAAEFIKAQPCECQHEEPCDRCEALGRFLDVQVER